MENNKLAHLIFVRHGERADRKDKDNCINDDDTNITAKGIECSILTGQNLVLRFQELDMLDRLNDLKIVSSPWYRCIETTQHVIAGMASKLQEIGQTELAETIQEFPYHLEEAFMERIKGRTAERVERHSIFCDPEFPENKFPEIKFLKNTLIDYEVQGDHLTHRTLFEERLPIFRASFNAFDSLIEKCQSEDCKHIYLVNTHGMTVEATSIFAKEDQIAMPTGPAIGPDGKKNRPKFVRPPYCATNFWEISKFERKTNPEDLDIEWEIESRFILKLAGCADPNFKKDDKK